MEKYSKKTRKPIQRGIEVKILLIGDFSSNYDEGLKNIAKYFYKLLSSNHEVDQLNVKEITLKKLLKVNNNYDIIHYFTSPTLSSIIMMKFFSIKSGSSKKIVSCLHPDFSIFIKNRISRKLIGLFFKVDILLYQADKQILKDMSDILIYLSNGVDIKKFKPAKDSEKIRLREKYGLETDKFTILHVGHISEKRNLEILAKIKNMNNNFQILIVSGKYLGIDKIILENLKKSGCNVLINYYPNIEEIYALSDCYVFPVLWGNTINIPLTILEAMATNLPVVSLDYPTLTIFNQKGLYLAENTQDILKEIKNLKNDLDSDLKVRNREKVLNFSWEIIVQKLESVYEKC